MTKGADVKTSKKWEAEFKTNFIMIYLVVNFVAYDVIHVHGVRKEYQVGLNLAGEVFPNIVWRNHNERIPNTEKQLN